jgi:hypothetical protein
MLLQAKASLGGCRNKVLLTEKTMERKDDVAKSKEARFLLGTLKELDSTFATKVVEYKIIDKIKDDLIQRTSAGSVGGFAYITSLFTSSSTSIRENASYYAGGEYAYIPQEKLNLMLNSRQLAEKIEAIENICAAIHDAVKDLDKNSPIDELIAATEHICNATIAPGINQEHINQYFSNANKVQDVYASLNGSQKELFDRTFNELTQALVDNSDFNPDGKYTRNLGVANSSYIFALDMQYPTRIKMLVEVVDKCLKGLKNNHLGSLSEANLEIMLKIAVMLQARMQKITLDLSTINDQSKPKGGI